MNESQYGQFVDDLLLQVEDALEDSGADVDYETSGGVLTITCEQNGSQIIVSRQPSMVELWVAAKSGGFHLQWQAEKSGFYCGTTHEDFVALLSRVLTEQCDETVVIALAD